MDTATLAVFVNTATAGNLSRAARRLRIAPMTATRKLAALERELGVRLMQRSTRSLSLTPEGESFLPYAVAMLENEDAGRASVAQAGPGAVGLLRVTAPAAFGRKVVTPLIPRLLQENPGLRVDIELTDNVVDIVAAGVDVAIRVGTLRESGLVARRLALNPRLLCAAPAYLRSRGTPSTIDDLAKHSCLMLTGTTHWRFVVRGQHRGVRIAGPFSSNSIEGIHQACIGGAGLALLSRWYVRDDLREGSLVPITLASAEPQQLTIWAVCPTSRHVLPKLQVFLAAVQNALDTHRASVTPLDTR